MSSQESLLICTVGGTPEPIVAALKHWQPRRVRFVPTPETRDQIADRILPLAAAEDVPIDAGRYDLLELPDGQDLARCVDRLRELTPEVESWLARGEDFQVVVDFTGGTKCMSAALALQAHRWRCRFSYIGGQERTKDGVGVVVSGKEQVLHTHNPWDALGYQAVEEATTLFDQGAFAAVSKLLERTLRNIQTPARKRELQALKSLADAYDAWDRFEHREALGKFGDVQRYENDLSALMGRNPADALRRHTADHRAFLSTLVGDAGPTAARVRDLLANARRRHAEGRDDDGVARLYRAIEAIAQARLREMYRIEDTSKVLLELLPEELRQIWASRAKNGTVFLGLQDDYALLASLDDPLGAEFRQLGLDNRERSPLVGRNQSILAHGFSPVGDRPFRQLWGAALHLAAVTEAELPTFPHLAAAQ